MKKISLRKSTLIMVAGSPGSGKTTVCRNLVSHICDLTYIEKDPIAESFLMQKNATKSYWGLSGKTIPVTDPFYAEHVRNQTYRCMLALALGNLRMGNSALIESSYIKEIMQGYIDSEIMPQLADFDFRLLFFYADEAIIKQRLIQRNALRDAEKLSSTASWIVWLEKEPLRPQELDRHDHLLVDTSNQVEENVQCIVGYLAK